MSNILMAKDANSHSI